MSRFGPIVLVAILSCTLGLVAGAIWGRSERPYVGSGNLDPHSAELKRELADTRILLREVREGLTTLKASSTKSMAAAESAVLKLERFMRSPPSPLAVPTLEGVPSNPLTVERAKLADWLHIHEPDLVAIEGEVADERKWPSTGAPVSKLRNRIRTLLDTFPQDEKKPILKRLALVTWGIQALSVLASKGPTADKTPDTAVTIRSLLEAAPEEAPSALTSKLIESLSKLDQESEAHLRVTALDEGRKALTGKLDVQSALMALRPFTNDKEAQTLRTQLQQSLSEARLADQLRGLREAMKRASTFPNVRVRLAAIGRVQDAAVGAFIDQDLESENVRSAKKADFSALIDECTDALEKIDLAAQGEQGRKFRDYQRWSLGEILKFHKEDWYVASVKTKVKAELRSFKKPERQFTWSILVRFPKSAEIIKEKFGVDVSDVQSGVLSVEKQLAIYAGWKSGFDDDLARFCGREAFVEMLLPIQVSLLDEPVRLTYQQVFSKGWGQLEENPDDKEIVAHQCAVAKKRLLE